MIETLFLGAAAAASVAAPGRLTAQAVQTFRRWHNAPCAISADAWWFRTRATIQRGRLARESNSSPRRLAEHLFACRRTDEIGTHWRVERGTPARTLHDRQRVVRDCGGACRFAACH